MVLSARGSTGQSTFIKAVTSVITASVAATVTATVTKVVVIPICGHTLLVYPPFPTSVPLQPGLHGPDKIEVGVGAGAWAGSKGLSF